MSHSFNIEVSDATVNDANYSLLTSYVYAHTSYSSYQGFFGCEVYSGYYSGYYLRQEAPYEFGTTVDMYPDTCDYYHPCYMSVYLAAYYY